MSPEQTSTTPSRGIDRRTVVRTTAWGIPAVAVAGAAPAFAASGPHTWGLNVEGDHRPAFNIAALGLPAITSSGGVLPTYSGSITSTQTNLLNRLRNFDSGWTEPAVEYQLVLTPGSLVNAQFTGVVKYNFHSFNFDIFNEDKYHAMTDVKVEVLIPVDASLAIFSTGTTRHLRTTTSTLWDVSERPAAALELSLINTTLPNNAQLTLARVLTFTLKAGLSIPPDSSLPIEFYYSTQTNATISLNSIVLGVAGGIGALLGGTALSLPITLPAIPVMLGTGFAWGTGTLSHTPAITVDAAAEAVTVLPWV